MRHPKKSPVLRLLRSDDLPSAVLPVLSDLVFKSLLSQTSLNHIEFNHPLIMVDMLKRTISETNEPCDRSSFPVAVESEKTTRRPGEDAPRIAGTQRYQYQYRLAHAPQLAFRKPSGSFRKSHRMLGTDLGTGKRVRRKHPAVIKRLVRDTSYAPAAGFQDQERCLMFLQQNITNPAYTNN